MPATLRRCPRRRAGSCSNQLSRLTGSSDLRLGQRLAHDLGIDSLGAAELVLWIEKEFGFSVGTPESLVTVGDVVLAAAGKGISALAADVRRPSAAWLSAVPARRGLIEAAPGHTITEVFLNQAAKDPGRLILRGPAEWREDLP